MISTCIYLSLVITWTCLVSLGDADNSSLLEFDGKEMIENGFQVGTMQVLDPQNYTINTLCQPQEWNISNPKAAALWLEFDSITLPSNDQLVMVSINGTEIPINTTTPSLMIRSPTVIGNSIQLKYRPSPFCSSTLGTGTFSLNRLGIKYSKQWMVQKEAVCGNTNTMKNAICFANDGDTTDAIMYAKSRAVLRTEQTRSDGVIVVCTAWLWGTQGHMITNHHCFSSQEMVDQTAFMFGSEVNSCDGQCTPGSCPAAHVVQGHVKFIATDPILDVTVLQLTQEVEMILDQYGYLQIRFGYPLKGEAIYIPQHPLGGARKIAKTDDDNDSTIATIKELNQSIKIGDQTYTDLIGYSADTESGSSGSPVISRVNHQVIGLHRIGNCDNAATPSQRLFSFLSPLTTDVNAFTA